jgi:hypothetical protein
MLRSLPVSSGGDGSNLLAMRAASLRRLRCLRPPPCGVLSVMLHLIVRLLLLLFFYFFIYIFYYMRTASLL